MNEQQPQQLQIKVEDAVLKGAYSNAMQVSHTREEFILDFFLTHPPAGILSARVITSPGHLKRIIAALEDNLKKYETQFGNVSPAEEPHSPIGFQPKS